MIYLSCVRNIMYKITRDEELNYIDCHCHIADNYFYKKIDSLLEDWINVGVNEIGAVATNIQSSSRNIELGKKYPRKIKIGIGRHPWGAHKFNDFEKKKFEELFKDSKIDFIGEIGLDRYFIKEEEKYPKQKEVLEFFLSFASRLKKPIMLHLTGAEKEILEILSNYKLNAPICCHWYSGPEDILKLLADLGCYFSINPAIIRSKNHRKVLDIVTIDKLLTESDGPVEFQGKKSSPILTKLVCEDIAEYKKLEEKNLIQKISTNYSNYLKGKK